MNLRNLDEHIDAVVKGNDAYKELPVPEEYEGIVNEAKLILGCEEFNKLVDNAKQNAEAMETSLPTPQGEWTGTMLFCFGYAKWNEGNPAFCFFKDKFHYVSNKEENRIITIEYSKIAMVKLYNDVENSTPTRDNDILELWLTDGEVIELKSSEYSFGVQVFLIFFVKNLKNKLASVQKVFLYSQGIYNLDNVPDFMLMVRNGLMQSKWSTLDVALTFRNHDPKGIISDYFFEQVRLNKMDQKLAELYYGIVNNYEGYGDLARLAYFNSKTLPKSKRESLATGRLIDPDKVFAEYKQSDIYPNTSYLNGYISSASDDAATLKTDDQQREFSNIERFYLDKKITKALDATKGEWTGNDQYFDDKRFSVIFCVVGEEVRYVLPGEAFVNVAPASAKAPASAPAPKKAPAAAAKKSAPVKEKEEPVTDAAVAERDEEIWAAVRKKMYPLNRQLENLEEYDTLEGGLTRISENMRDSAMYEVGLVFEEMGVPSTFRSSYFTWFGLPTETVINHQNVRDMKVPLDVFFKKYIGKHTYYDDLHNGIYQKNAVFSCDENKLMQYNIGPNHHYSDVLKNEQRYEKNELTEVNKSLKRYELPALVQLVYGLIRGLLFPALIALLVTYNSRSDGAFLVTLLGCFVGLGLTIAVSPGGFSDFRFALKRLSGGNKERAKLLDKKKELENKLKTFHDRIVVAEKWEDDWYKEASKLRMLEEYKTRVE